MTCLGNGQGADGAPDKLSLEELARFLYENFAGLTADKWIELFGYSKPPWETLDVIQQEDIVVTAKAILRDFDVRKKHDSN